MAPSFRSDFYGIDPASPRPSMNAAGADPVTAQRIGQLLGGEVVSRFGGGVLSRSHSLHSSDFRTPAIIEGFFVFATFFTHFVRFQLIRFGNRVR